MPNQLISDEEFAEIRGDINDVIFTFTRNSVIQYSMDKNTTTRFQKDITDARKYNTVNLNGLVVWDKAGADALAIPVDNKGAQDFNRGYILFAFDDCLAVGMVNAENKVTTKYPADKVVANGEELTVEGINVVGQLNGTMCLVKVHIQRPLKP